MEHFKRGSALDISTSIASWDLGKGESAVLSLALKTRVIGPSSMTAKHGGARWHWVVVTQALSGLSFLRKNGGSLNPFEKRL
jgi:hypothetical protein